MITAVVSDADIRACHPVMRQLRPHWREAKRGQV